MILCSSVGGRIGLAFCMRVVICLGVAPGSSSVIEALVLETLVIRRSQVEGFDMSL